MRIALAAALILTAASAPNLGRAEGRFALSARRDGVVRLDTATGAVSHCSPTKGVWRCETLPVEMSRLDALTMEVAALTAKVAALSASIKAPVPRAVRAEPPEPRASVVHEALSRFLALVHTLKYGRAT